MRKLRATQTQATSATPHNFCRPLTENSRAYDRPPFPRDAHRRGYGRCYKGESTFRSEIKRNDRVAPGRYRPGAPTDSYVRALPHTDPRITSRRVCRRRDLHWVLVLCARIAEGTRFASFFSAIPRCTRMRISNL
jgi:hypothetical protein